MKRRLSIFAALLAITFLVTLGLLAYAISVNTSRYYSELAKRNKESEMLVGAWVREGRTTQMILNADGTGIYLAKDGTEVQLDWTCDGTEFSTQEYYTPSPVLIRMRRIATMDTSMADICSVVMIDRKELHLLHSSDPSNLIRYNRVE